LQRLYGRAKRGQLVPAKRSGKRGSRISLLAALSQKQLLAPLRFEGHCDSCVFNQWMQECLIPVLRRGQTVIMDNASFHKSRQTKELIDLSNG